MGRKSRTKEQKLVEKHIEQSNDDDRFDAAETRPQFRSIKKQSTKVVLDERFSSVLTDPKFQLNPNDKYGRKKQKKSEKSSSKHGQISKEHDELGLFYTVEGGNDEKEEKNESNHGKDEKKHGKKKRKEPQDHDDDDDNNESDNNSSSSSSSNDDVDERKDENENDRNEDEDPASRIAYLTAFSRGEIDMSSSSSDDDDSSDSDSDDDVKDGEDSDDDGEDPVYGTAGVLDPSTKYAQDDDDENDGKVEISYDDSPYLVVTQMDWEHIRAVDLFVILSSFTPPGAIKRVQVFQSDFGIQQMAKDRLHGPSDIWRKKKKQNDGNSKGRRVGVSLDDDNSDDDSDGSNSYGDEDDDDDRLEDEKPKLNVEDLETDYDPEKLRAYEASKLKYYFAVVEFAESRYADVAYREIDGHEFEHSSAAIDLGTLPPDQVDSVVTDRPMRDEATSVPGDYEPPEFVVSALQQTNVQCTWDQGDTDRERKLTKYGAGGGWRNLAENDDLKAYLASDGSSEDDSDEEMAEKKGANMRKLLGLDSHSDDDEDEKNQSDSEEDSDDKSGDGSNDEDGKDMEMKFIPGKASLEEMIRSKLKSKEEDEEEPKALTPWEKYKEKRRLKRKERRQAARGGSRRNVDDGLVPSGDDDSEEAPESDNDDDFLVSDRKEQLRSKQKAGNVDDKSRKASQELELLIAGDADEEQARDFDIRGIQRLEKNKGKKLRGARKRKEDKIAADVSGIDFQVDTKDNRFAAVLEGSDARFGIDKTDPNYKDTSGMRDILEAQQSTRRKKKKRKQSSVSNNADVVVVPNVSADHSGQTAGSSALSSLVQRLKSNVAKTSVSN